MVGQRVQFFMEAILDASSGKRGVIGRANPYGLRHTVAVILREIGHGERTIADALGQRRPEMALHYAKQADLKPKMRGVVQSFEQELDKRRTKHCQTY